MDTFARIQMAAMVTAIDPTPAQAAAQNYKKGRVALHGLKIAIENARGTERKGVGADGTAWSNMMQNHYGHFVGFIGNDGDGVDVFIGAWPESKQVWIINQKNQDGSFDEHKVMLGFTSEEAARNGYLGSYSAGWQGLESIVACNVEQLAWWLKYGNKSKPVTPESLPDNGSSDMNKIFDSAVELAKLIYGIRKDDPESHALDAITMDEIMADSEGEPALDALVIEFVKVERKMGQMQAIMNAAGDALSVSAVQVTPPFKQRGTTNVAGVFELSDGQTVSVFFHNPDVTPNRIAPQDELVSWKWMLNKKDITILVAPEKGDDLNAREVSRRIMKVAEKNSARFAKANTDKAARVEAIEGMKTDIVAREQELQALEAEIAELETAKETAGKKAAADEGAAIVAAWKAGDADKAWELASAREFGAGAKTKEEFINDMTSFHGAAVKSNTFSSMSGQQKLAYRASRIASLLAMNEQIRALDPAEAWHPDNITDASDSDLDALQDKISALLVELQKGKSAKGNPILFGDDIKFLQQAALGKVDFYDKAVTDDLARIAKDQGDRTDNPDLIGLIKQAKTAAKNFFMAEFQKKTAA